MSQNHEDNSTDIIIPDNIAQQVMFGNDFNHVSYGYVHVNINKDLAIKFYPKHRAQYTIKIYYNFEDSKNIKTILSNEIIYLEYREWRDQCPTSQKSC